MGNAGLLPCIVARSFLSIYWKHISHIFCLLIVLHVYIKSFIIIISQKLLFCGIAISLPTFGAMLGFDFMVAQVSCSISLVIFAYLLTIDGKTLFTKWILPIILCSFATFTYQSLLYIFPGLFLIDCLLDKFNIAKKSSYRILGRIVGICIISLVCYVGGSLLLHLITGIPKHRHGVWMYLSKSVEDGFIFMYRWVVLRFNSTLLSSFLFLPIPFGIILLCGKHRLRHAILIFFIICYFLFPFLGLGIALPMRAWFFVPFIYAAIFLCAYINTPLRLRIFFFIFSIWIVCYNSSINARFALLDNITERCDQLIASRVYNEIYDMPKKYLKSTKGCLIIGGVILKRILPKISDSDRDAYGVSLFSWGRAYNYLSIFGVNLPPMINSPSEVDRIKSQKIVQDMPEYPEKGFVRIVDDVLVIKLSNYKK